MVKVNAKDDYKATIDVEKSNKLLIEENKIDIMEEIKKLEEKKDIDKSTERGPEKDEKGTI